MLKLYGIKNCTTMKKAFAWLEENGIEYTFVDYKNPAVLEERLPLWVKTAGVEALLNRRGLTWKRLSETERAASAEKELIALLAAHPTLVRRPVLEHGGFLLIGFEPERYRALFEEKR